MKRSNLDDDTRSALLNRRRLLQGIAATGVATAAGCLGDDDDDPGVADDGDDDPGVADDDDDDPDEIPMDGEFIASLAANPSTFDPTIVTDATSNSAVGTMCYEGLFDPDFDIAEFRPALATGWEQVDPTTWEVEVREGVEFHNGDELTPEDVVFSIERQQGTVNDASVEFVEEMEIEGNTVTIVTEEPHAPFLSDIGAVPILPSNVDGISREPTEDDFPFDEESIGTGPWLLDEFVPEDRVELLPNENYWYDGDEHPPYPPWETVTLRVVPEQVSQQEAILAGELDMIDNAAPFELDLFDGEDPEVVSAGGLGFDFVSYPTTVSPFSNPKFRRGLTRLIPREAIIEAIFGGNAVSLGGPISPGLGAFWDEAHEQELRDNYVGEDPEEAERLLEEAFEEEDIEPPFEISFITNVNRTRERWMEVIQQAADETEFFDAELEIQPFDQLVPFLLDPEGAAQSTDVVGIGWTGGSDPDGHVDQLLHSRNHVPNGFNWNLYANDEVDELIEEGKRELDEQARADIYHEMQEILAEDVPEAFMWTGDQIDVVLPDRVQNWRPYPNSSNRYWGLYRPNLDQVAWQPE